MENRIHFFKNLFDQPVFIWPLKTLLYTWRDSSYHYRMNAQQRAEEMIRQRGERMSRARAVVLAVLLAESGAKSHPELEQLLSKQQQMDRVTLYRSLSWLESKGFIHKVVGVDRASRYQVNPGGSDHRHAHFKCIQCNSVVCLAESSVDYQVHLPSGYQGLEMELTIKGICPQCG